MRDTLYPPDVCLCARHSTVYPPGCSGANSRISCLIFSFLHQLYCVWIMRCAFFVLFSMLLARDGGFSSCVILYTRRTFVFVRDTTVPAGVFAPIFCLFTFFRSQVSSIDFRVHVFVAPPSAPFSTSVYPPGCSGANSRISCLISTS